MCAQIGLNPTGKRPGQAAVQPGWSKDHHASEEAQTEITTADGSSNAGSFKCGG
jgi:hypothetical protein